MSAGLPRWIAIGIALLGLSAIVSGAREGAPTPAVPVAAHFDTAFVRANGFMMDSLRLGRLRLDTTTNLTVPRVRARPRAAPPAGDSLRYSPRGCMPE